MPRRYEDRRTFAPIGRLRPGEVASVLGRGQVGGDGPHATGHPVLRDPGGGPHRHPAGSLVSTALPGAHLSPRATRVILTGRLSPYPSRQMVNPEHEIEEADEIQLSHRAHRAHLPADRRSGAALPAPAALRPRARRRTASSSIRCRDAAAKPPRTPAAAGGGRALHAPADAGGGRVAARRRLAFDEFFLFSLAVLRQRAVARRPAWDRLRGAGPRGGAGARDASIRPDPGAGARAGGRLEGHGRGPTHATFAAGRRRLGEDDRRVPGRPDCGRQRLSSRRDGAHRDPGGAARGAAAGAGGAPGRPGRPPGRRDGRGRPAGGAGAARGAGDPVWSWAPTRCCVSDVVFGRLGFVGGGRTASLRRPAASRPPGQGRPSRRPGHERHPDPAESGAGPIRRPGPQRHRRACRRGDSRSPPSGFRRASARRVAAELLAASRGGSAPMWCARWWRSRRQS